MVNITVVGVPEDGCTSLTSLAVNVVTCARVVAGHPRHRAWFPGFDGLFLDMTQGFSAWMHQIVDESEEGDVVVLASGDPLFFGVGTTLINRIGSAALRFIPTISSAQLAFARLGLAWQQARFLSVHGRGLSGVSSQMQQGDLFAILTDGKNTPQSLAQHLLRFGHSDWQLSVCEQLGGLNEQIHSFSVDQLALTDRAFDKLNIVVGQRTASLLTQNWGGQGQFSDDHSFDKRMPKQGLITKQPIRHLALTAMRLQPQQVVWDIGAGSGSVAIESAKFCWNGEVFAIECNASCFDAIEANAEAHGTDNVVLIRDKAPDALIELPNPDAVFIGGSRGQMDAILSVVWQRLNLGGRLVVTAVTLDTVAELYQWAKSQELTFDVQLISVAQTQPLAHYQGYQAQNPIHLFSMTKNCAGIE